jgi:hypothetical protein
VSNTFIDFWHDERLDQSETLGFTIPVRAPKAELVVEDTELRWRDRFFIVRQVERERSGADAVLRVECDALWYRLGEDTLVGSVLQPVATTSTGATGVPEPETLRGGANIILAGSGWTLDQARTPAGGDRFVMEEQDLTRLALLRRWANITGTHLRFDTAGKRVAFTTTQGAESPASFRYGRNLERIMRRSTPPVATVLYPFGRDELGIEGVNGGSPFVEDFSFYTALGLTLSQARARYTKRRVWRDDRYLIDTNLRDAAVRKLAEWSVPTVSYECKVVDLAELVGFDEAQGLAVGDTVRVADSVLGIEVRAVVARLKRYPLEPWRNEIELSSLPERPGDTSSSTRGTTSMSWAMFKDDNAAEYRLRNDGSYLVNRIGLRFREGGEAVFGYDVNAVGVGTGSLAVSAFDAETGGLLHRPLVIPYTDGQVIHENMTWAMKGLVGQKDVRIRMVATASDGASALRGVNVLTGESRLWVLAYGGVQQTPTLPNTIRYLYTGAVQHFTVPDNVFEITVDAYGGGGGAGGGGRVGATFPVVPGQQFDVYVGGKSSNDAAGWPNGGAGDRVTGGGFGRGGGGSSDLRPSGSGFASAWIVAAGAGGGGEGVLTPGGGAGFYVGQDGNERESFGLKTKGTGSPNQWTGGTGGLAINYGPPPFTQVGENGTFGQGGAAGDTGNSFAYCGGGGGGGWWGGGGGGAGGGGGLYGGGGGGGTGWIAPASGYFDLVLSDNVNDAHGYIDVSWANPL